MATTARTRMLLHGAEALQRGQPGQLRVTLAHPMETGHRRDADGQLVPRDIATRFEARLDGRLVFAADLYPAVAANPYLAFWLRADGPGELSLEWTGDNGFALRETRRILPA